MPFPKGALLKIRDPNDTNPLLSIEFADALAEPPGVRSCDCVWQMSYRCFTGPKVCVYRLLSFFCGCCMALEWGCAFGVLSFMQVYCYTPYVNLCGIWGHCIKGHVGACAQCCCAPIFEVGSLLFETVAVTKTIDGDKMLPFK